MFAIVFFWIGAVLVIDAFSEWAAVSFVIWTIIGIVWLYVDKRVRRMRR